MNKINIFIINKHLKNKGNDSGKIIPFLFQIKLKYMCLTFTKNSKFIFYSSQFFHKWFCQNNCKNQI